MVPIMLPAEFYIAISKLMAEYDISKSAALLLVINDGLKKRKLLTPEVYDIFKARYTRSLLTIVQAGRDTRANPKGRCMWAAGSRIDRCRRLAVVKMKRGDKVGGACPGHIEKFVEEGYKVVREENDET